MRLRAASALDARVVGRLSAARVLAALVLVALAGAGALRAPPSRAEEAAGAEEAADAAAGVAVERGLPDEIARAEAQLREPEWIDRLSGAYALQRMGAGAAPAARALVAALGDENGSVRFECAEALARIGAPAVPALAGALSSSSAETRALAARTLGRIGLGARGALPELRTLLNDPAPEVREAAEFALPMIEPQGIRGWLWKLGFEIGDEPWGIPLVVAAFVAVSLVGTLRSGLRTWRTRGRAPAVGESASAAARTSATADAGARAGDAAAGAAADDDEEEDADADADDADAEQDEVETGDGGRDGAPASTAGTGRIATAAAAPGAGARGRAVQPTQGLPFAIAGLIALAVAGLVVLLSTLRPGTPDERHGIYHFAGLFALFGYLFVKLGVKGEWIARRARARRQTTGERWLADRAWRRDGTGPIKAERVAPNLLALVLWIAFLTPFHTVWALPWSYWGVWIVLGIFDLIGIAILVAVVRRAWWRLRAGRCFLRWQGVPVRPGATFVARFESARALAGGAPLEATLRCLRDRSENRVIGDEPAADADEVYAERKSFALHDRPEGGSWAQVSFAVPASARGTDSYAARPVRWVVVVSLPGVGPDFRTTFPVPIYR